MLRVRATGTGWTGAPGLFTYYFMGASLAAEGVPEATEAVARVRALFQAAASTMASGAVWSVSPVCDQIDPATGILVSRITGATVATVAGSGPGNSAPPAVALVGQLTTGVVIGGRAIRGRTFLTPVANNSLTATGDPSGATISGMTTAVGKLGVTITTALANVVWHRPVNGAGGAGAAVTGYSIWSRCGVLRSRRD